ncbi:MAG: type II secretion system F family protein [Gordonibacter sp.]|nr:type II secretion system F family protein [Gordonibacter sp.]MEA5065317.1 type II secretion system F family protein [Eubacteriales bacterium]
MNIAATATAIMALALATLAFALVMFWNIQVASRDAEYARRIGYTARMSAENTREPRTGFGRSFSASLTRAGIETRPFAVLAAVASACMLVGSLLYLVLGAAGFVAGIACAAVGARALMGYLGARRAKSFGRQLADVLPMTAQHLRAGMSVETAFASVARFVPQPAKDEFQRVADEVRFGRVPIDKALGHMAVRTGDKDAEFLATAVGVQKIGGGNLSELLESTATRMESTQELQGDIDAITSQGRYASKFIAVFPFLVLGVVVFGAPDIGAAFWASPYWPLVVVALIVLDTAALVAVRRVYKMPTD